MVVTNAYGAPTSASALLTVTNTIITPNPPQVLRLVQGWWPSGGAVVTANGLTEDNGNYITDKNGNIITITQ